MDVPMPPPPRKQQQQADMPPPSGRPPASKGRNDVMPPPSSPKGGADVPLPPPQRPPEVSGRDLKLLEMQKIVVAFYEKHAPDKVEKEVIALALQLWWDSGLSALNQKLSQKYGATLAAKKDILADFDRQGEEVTIMPKDDVMSQAAKSDHLVVETMVKKNSSDYFKGDIGATKSIRFPVGVNTQTNPSQASGELHTSFNSQSSGHSSARGSKKSKKGKKKKDKSDGNNSFQYDAARDSKKKSKKKKHKKKHKEKNDKRSSPRVSSSGSEESGWGN